MIEEYSFLIGNTTIDPLNDQFGLVLREVQDSGAVSWDIATSKNPYQNGVQINNRTANARQISMLFQYKGTVEPYVSDEKLFNVLAPAINGEKITIIKKRGTVQKQINGVIQSITQLIYTDVPTLEIVFLTDSFWHGAIESITPTMVITGGPAGNYYQAEFTVKGNVDPEFVNICFVARQVADTTTRRIDVILNNEPFFSFGYVFPPISTTDLTAQRIWIESAPFNKLYVESYKNDDITSTVNLLGNVVNGNFPKFKVGTTNTLYFSMNMDNGVIIDPNKTNSLEILYIPLYIR